MKRNLKLVLTFALVSSLVFSCTAMVYATDAKLVTPNSATRDEAYLTDLEEFKTEVKNHVNSVGSTARLGGHKTLSVPLKQQQAGNYCGPASIQMVLAYNGISKAQSHIADKIGTIDAGSDIAPMTTYLNNQLGSGTYKYVNVTDLAFGEGVVYSIDKSKPVICLVETRELPYYHGHASKHFIVVKGYDWDMNGSSSYSTVKINDPNNNSKYYGSNWSCTWSEMTKGLKGVYGWYITAK